MEIIGYLISLILLYGLIYSTLRLSNFITDYLTNKYYKNSVQNTSLNKQKITLKSIEQSKNYYNFLISFTIKNLIQNNVNHSNIVELFKLLRISSLSSSFSTVLNKYTISDLNILKYKLKEDLKNNKPLFENKLAKIILTAITSEKFIPKFTDLLTNSRYGILGITAIIFIINEYIKRKKEILLKHEYVISEIDRIIQLKSKINKKS
ncbi:hypothetical protein ACWOCB_06605 [Gemella haemolysans]|uniref:Uncharacterized protein n=1 Tax=Gemella haemolysans ATCC 10379 TaxID=546270 RepID=C5NWH5_9BACL|nr:hypothetical protein [Gemella haemolysans]EER68482.1 hypothetical protein GEMHA0001_1115 [Gemella haemolysans ATCC 10379]KAA8707201.1 hypothetical protein F4V11_06495 [Gemella haemolysans]UBH82209.1 hypothetical protein LA340_07790 [Gemella haemolysans]VEI37875.1 Uncharacterised protein [Gemella haemolysans]